LYFISLNLYNSQIAQELRLGPDDVQPMTEQWRGGIVARQPEPFLSGEVEGDEVYVVAGHPVIRGFLMRLKTRPPRMAAPAEGRGTLENEKPPIFGMIQRGGTVAVRMLENVQPATIQPLIEPFITPGTRVYTDDIDHRLPDWGFDHRTVGHGRGEYARDEDGDGFHEDHVNTAEGFWSWLRSWLRPHWGISQEKLPLYLGFFEFVYNVRRRGRVLLGSLLDTLLQPVACPQNPI
jgi:transposase-like protein